MFYILAFDPLASVKLRRRFPDDDYFVVIDHQFESPQTSTTAPYPSPNYQLSALPSLSNIPELIRTPPNLEELEENEDMADENLDIVEDFEPAENLENQQQIADEDQETYEILPYPSQLQSTQSDDDTTNFKSSLDYWYN